MTSNKVNQLQMLRQSLESVVMQKQQIESNLIEIDSAISQLTSSNKSFKIIGKIMIESSNDVLKKELVEKKEVIQIRLKNFASQEEKIKTDMEELQKEVVAQLKNDSSK
jgi:prefoldin beta subunit